VIALSSQQLSADVRNVYPYASALGAAVAAAQRDPAIQERLLLAVAAVDVDTPKLPIFKAALAARHDALADSIGRAMLPAYTRDRTEFAPNETETFLRFMPDPDRLTVARGLGEVNQRLGNTRVALKFYLIAQGIQASDPVKRTTDALRAQLDLESRNAARRPLVSDNIDQDHLVRPRETK
jgi:hypothetical protein